MSIFPDATIGGAGGVQNPQNQTYVKGKDPEDKSNTNQVQTVSVFSNYDGNKDGKVKTAAGEATSLFQMTNLKDKMDPTNLQMENVTATDISNIEKMALSKFDAAEMFTSIVNKFSFNSGSEKLTSAVNEQVKQQDIQNAAEGIDNKLKDAAKQACKEANTQVINSYKEALAEARTEYLAAGSEISKEGAAITDDAYKSLEGGKVAGDGGEKKGGNIETSYKTTAFATEDGNKDGKVVRSEVEERFTQLESNKLGTAHLTDAKDKEAAIKLANQRYNIDTEWGAIKDSFEVDTGIKGLKKDATIADVKKAIEKMDADVDKAIDKMNSKTEKIVENYIKALDKAEVEVLADPSLANAPAPEAPADGDVKPQGDGVKPGDDSDKGVKTGDNNNGVEAGDNDSGKGVKTGDNNNGVEAGDSDSGKGVKAGGNNNASLAGDVIDSLGGIAEALVEDTSKVEEKEGGKNEPLIHTVAQGESLSKIATKYETADGSKPNWKDLAKANDLNSQAQQNNLRIGQKLEIPENWKKKPIS